MANPISDLQSLARAPLDAARDLAVIAHALQALPEISAAVQPLPEAIDYLFNIPGIDEAAASVPVLVDAVASVPVLVDAVARVPTIEALLLSLIAALEPTLADVKELRKIVDAQQNQVTHIESIVERIERRTQVIERSVVDLQAKADQAMSVLPDPDDEGRGPLAKARDVITGGA